MTREEILRYGKEYLHELETGYCCKINGLHLNFVRESIKALEQESILSKIKTEIQSLRNCSCSCSDGIIDDVEDIIDKYKTESENKTE